MALKDELALERLEFVRQSSYSAKLRQHLIAAAAVVMTLLAVAAGLSAWFFLNARNRAEKNLVDVKQAIP